MKRPLLSALSGLRKVALFERYVSPESLILEVGSGSGWFTERLRTSGYRVTTIDLVPPADIIGDINAWRELGILPQSYDVIVALEVIEHVKCLEALRSICKPNGLIMLSSPHPRGDWLLKLLEFLHLSQKRTSPHSYLTDFSQIALPILTHKTIPLLHQTAIFVNVRDHK